MDSSTTKRDARLRRRLLDTLRLAMSRSPSGELSGRTLVECAESGLMEDQRFEDDDHAIRLLRELTAKGLIVERDARTYRRQRFGLDLLAYRITADGADLCDENRPPVPGVDDERL